MADNPLSRIDHLRLYFGALADDMNAAGQFSARGPSRTAAAVNAALAGAGAMAAQLKADLRILAGETIDRTASAAESLVAGLAADGAKAAMGWAGEQIRGLFNGAAREKPAQAKPNARRDAGRAIMKAARGMNGGKQ